MIEFEAAPLSPDTVPRLEEDAATIARANAADGSLPEFAAQFASLPGRFEAGKDPVRNLRFGRITVHEFDGGTAAELLLRGYPQVHTTDLVITYYGVIDVTFKPGDVASEASIMNPTTLGRSQLDSINPDPRGVVHEVEFSGGKLTVVCADLAPSWVPIGSRG